MGHWGVKSYETDGADEALDRAFERVHGDRYDELMDDRNPMSFDAVQKSLANAETLAASLAWLVGEYGSDLDDWDEEERLAYCGVVVRHAEFGVPIDAPTRDRAVSWLEDEPIDWDDEKTVRGLRRRREIELLRRGTGS